MLISIVALANLYLMALSTLVLPSLSRFKFFKQLKSRPKFFDAIYEPSFTTEKCFKYLGLPFCEH